MRGILASTRRVTPLALSMAKRRATPPVALSDVTFSRHPASSHAYNSSAGDHAVANDTGQRCNHGAG
jgi:hypothetical protein